MPEYENSEEAHPPSRFPHPRIVLTVPLPLFPLLRGHTRTRAHTRVHIRALLPAVESTAPPSEDGSLAVEAEGGGERRGEGIVAAAVSESAIPVSPLYRRPAAVERNSDRAWLSFCITANRSRARVPSGAVLGIHKGLARLKGDEIAARRLSLSLSLSFRRDCAPRDKGFLPLPSPSDRRHVADWPRLRGGISRVHHRG